MRNGRDSLTAIEMHILALSARGLSTKQIAAEMGRAASTINNHLATIYLKLDVANRTQAVAVALRDSLLPQANAD